jgi:hypothetical protein
MIARAAFSVTMLAAVHGAAKATLTQYHMQAGPLWAQQVIDAWRILWLEHE